LYTELFSCYHPYLVSLLFAVLLSLRHITQLFFTLVISLSFSNFSNGCTLELKFAFTEQQKSPHMLAGFLSWSQSCPWYRDSWLRY